MPYPLISWNAASAAAPNFGWLIGCGTRTTCRVCGLVDLGLDRGEQRFVGLGIEEGLPGSIEQRDTTLRQQETNGPLALVQLRGDERAELLVLVHRRAHQRHLRVVHVEQAIGELGGYRLDRSEVDHVESAARADVGNAGASDCTEPVRAAGEDAPDEVVGNLGGGHVEHRSDHS